MIPFDQSFANELVQTPTRLKLIGSELIMWLPSFVLGDLFVVTHIYFTERLEIVMALQCILPHPRTLNCHYLDLSFLIVLLAFIHIMIHIYKSNDLSLYSVYIYTLNICIYIYIYSHFFECTWFIFIYTWFQTGGTQMAWQLDNHAAMHLWNVNLTPGWIDCKCKLINMSIYG